MTIYLPRDLCHTWTATLLAFAWNTVFITTPTPRIESMQCCTLSGLSVQKILAERSLEALTETQIL